MMKLIEWTEERELALKAVVYGCNTNRRLQGANFMTDIHAEQPQTISFYNALHIISEMMNSTLIHQDLILQGEWEDLDGEVYRCTNCHHAPIVNIDDKFVLSNFCPHCGARMVKS